MIQYWADASLKIDKLLISQLGLLAQRRLARGVVLNHTEATVLVHSMVGVDDHQPDGDRRL